MLRTPSWFEITQLITPWIVLQSVLLPLLIYGYTCPQNFLFPLPRHLLLSSSIINVVWTALPLHFTILLLCTTHCVVGYSAIPPYTVNGTGENFLPAPFANINQRIYLLGGKKSCFLETMECAVKRKSIGQKTRQTQVKKKLSLHVHCAVTELRILNSNSEYMHPHLSTDMINWFE